MRTIKYRAWLKDERRWADHNEQLSEVDVSASVRKPSVLSIGSDRYELCMFTGLTDKNGVEIYEGDVLYFEIFDGLVDVKGKAKVYFEKGCFRLNRIHPLCDYFNVGTVEVIGNIYENPEVISE